MKWTDGAWLAACVALAINCGGPTPQCTPGMTIACPCFGGVQGMQTCSSSGSFSACACPDAAAPDAPAADVSMPLDVAADAPAPMDAPAPTDVLAPTDAPAPTDVLAPTDAPAPADAPAPDDVATLDAPPPDVPTPPDAGGRAPTITLLTTNATMITDGESVTFTAVVNDPDGPSDIDHGTLLDAATAGTYGTFAPDSSPGVYTFALTWSQISAVATIQFMSMGLRSGEEMRMFTADFVDRGGLHVTRAVTVRLHCDGRGANACAGHCANISVDRTNCGGCGVRCSATGSVCSSGVCGCPTSGMGICSGACAYLQSDVMNCGACGNSCAVPGSTTVCRAGACLAQGVSTSTTSATSCDAICATLSRGGRALACAPPSECATTLELPGIPSNATYACSLSGERTVAVSGCSTSIPASTAYLGETCPRNRVTCCCR